MILLLTGLGVWFGVHLFPVLFAYPRKKLMVRVGVVPYKLVFAVLIIASIVLMVLGWRSIELVSVYPPPSWGRKAAMLLTLMTFVLFVAAKARTNIKRVLRHPQLLGLVLWGIGHLLANGDQRSMILFTTLTVWAVLEIVLINRRDGAWKKPAAVPARNDVFVIVGGVVLYAVLLWVHPYLSGIRLSQEYLQ